MIRNAHAMITDNETDLDVVGADTLTVGDIAARLADAGNANGERAFRMLMPFYFDEYASLPGLRHAA